MSNQPKGLVAVFFTSKKSSRLSLPGGGAGFAGPAASRKETEAGSHIAEERNSSEWKPALLHAVPISLFILGLFYYWFTVADRHAIFLYGHLGATPFDDVTSSRYWMSGLVASGAVMIVYTIVNWLLGQVAAFRRQDYCPPAWWRVWVLCVTPLAIGIPAITMTLNWPTLPPSNATACVVITLTGLALALAPGSLAAQRPSDLGWLMFDGVGLMPSLLLLRAVELPGRGLVSVPTAYLVALGGTFAGAVWLGVMTGLRMWRSRASLGASNLFIAGLCLSYLLMPLAHHLLFTPPDYRYISASSNFFAGNIYVQFLVFFVAAILAIGVTRLRRRVIHAPIGSERPDAMKTMLFSSEKPSRLFAIGESLLVTAIWASSFVLVKVVLTYMGPLTVAGLRYFLAFLVLLPLIARNKKAACSLPLHLWMRLFAIGISAYTVGNGALFWGLKYLPATTGSFLMSISPLLVMFADIIWLKEIPTRWQVTGVIVCLIGSVLFFSPGLRPGEPLGIAIVSVGLLGFALFGILGRGVARDQQIGTLSLTAMPLAFGGGFLLLVALPLERLPNFAAIAWAIVLWLAIINTALAYILYNHSLQVLTALEMNVMLNLTPLGTAVLAWLFLGETLTIVQIVGVVTVISGVIFVQQARMR